MKAILLSVIETVGLIFMNASAQDTIQFTFIGKVGGDPDTVIITSVKEFKMEGIQVVHIGDRTLDSLKTYILWNYRGRKDRVASPNNTTADTLDSVREIKITGIYSMPLYF